MVCVCVASVLFALELIYFIACRPELNGRRIRARLITPRDVQRIVYLRVGTARGLLLPKIVVSLGVKRTDAGWLGNGIYFGNAICTSANYAHPGKRGTRLVSVASVSLGTVKQNRKITYGLNKPPEGFHSCHGVRGSEFADDEFVVYDTKQQRLEYLVEVA